MTTKKIAAKKKAVTVKKKVTKPRIGLDPKGIDKLEKIMLANGKYFYNQRVFGQIRDMLDEYGEVEPKLAPSLHTCETELCAAGFARLLAVGKEKLYREVKRHTQDFSNAFAQRCRIDGVCLLGISLNDRGSIPIFGYSCNWPHDLADRFDALDGKPMAQVRQYIRMLRTRANSDGSLTEKGQKRY